MSIANITEDYSQITFEAGHTFMWAPSTKTVFYVDEAMETDEGLWSLLHELGHALLEHQTYQDDLELLMMEVSAWAKAKEISTHYGAKIKEAHIESCIESYRIWLHQRSKCIDCGVHSLQSDKVTYQCHNCQAKWRVPESKICRIRRTRIV